MSRVSLQPFARTLASALLLAAAMVLLCGAESFAQEPANSDRAKPDRAPLGTVAYRNATIETMGPSGRLENATLVIRDGKIIAVGTDVDVPDNARIVDAAGKTIMPGIVDPYFVFTQQAGGGGGGRGGFGRGGGRGGRGGFTPQPATGGGFRRISDYFYPYDVDLVPSARSGITTANLVLNGTGQSAVAYILPEDLENLLVEPDGFLYAAVTNQTSSLNFVRNGLNPQASNRGGRGGIGGGRGGFGGRGRGRGGQAPPQSSQFQDQDQQDQDDEEEDEEDSPSDTEQLWNQVRAGEKPLFVNVNNTATVLYLLKAVANYDDARFAMVCSGSNVYEVMDQLAETNITLILQPGIDTVPYTSERVNIPRMAMDNGVPFVFSMSLNRGQLNALQDDPMFPIAMLVKSGLPRDAALQALTIGPAKMLGMDETVGSLEENKLANLLIFAGDPLETGSRLEQVMVEGRTVHEN